MPKQIRETSSKLIVFLIIAGGFFVFQSGRASAAINQQINFQGKVTNTDGTNVTNGSYNFLFCIYTTGSPSTPCTSGANNDAIWRESKSITVTDGIFQTNLGDSTALPGSVNFNTNNIYLGVNFNSNGQMTPLVQFTAAPYAFNSNNLEGNTWEAPGTIGSTTPNSAAFTTLSSNGNTTLASNAGSTLALGNTTGGLTINSGGTSSWTNTTGGLTIQTSGSGTLALTSAGALNFSAGAASTVTLPSVTNALVFNGNTLDIDAANHRVGIGTTTPAALLDVTGSASTATGISVQNTNTSGTSAEYIKNSIASGTLANGLLFENTGAGTVTNAISILETAGTVATAINIGNNVGTGISIGTGVTTGISIASGGETITGGALAINNATGITSNQSTLVINAGGTVDVQDTLNADALTADTGGVTIASGQSYSGSGAVTLTSAAGTGLTVDSGTIGALGIGSGSNAKTITIGNATGATTVNINSGTGGINFQVAGTNTSGTVQIGADAGSATPDLLGLDTGSAEPAGTNGAMYYSTALNSFRCYQNGAWTNCIGSGSGSPAGSNTQIQYNNSGSFGANAGLTFNSSTQTLGLNGTNALINMSAITTEPTAPAAGTMDFYTKSIAGRMMPKFVGPSGLDTVVQPLLANNKVGWWNATGNTTTVPVVIGFTAPSTQGTATTRSVATTNLFTRVRRLGYVTTTTAGGLAGQYNGAAAQNQYTVGTGTLGVGGFFYDVRFGCSDAATVSGAREFVGLSSGTSAPTNVEPSTLTNVIGVGHGTSDTTMHVYYGGSAAQTPIDLSASFPANTLSTDMYELILFSPSSSNSTVGYRVTDITTGAQASGTLTAATPGTQLPASTTYLGHRAWRTNNATALAAGIDISSIYIETDN